MRPLRLGSLIDVGANIGQFSLLTRALHPAARIHAFEPLPEAAGRFERLFQDDETVTLHRLAAGEESGEAVIHISGRADSSSLLPILDRQNAIFPGTAEAGSATITVVRIDDLLAEADLPEPILVKLDVQGFELAALRGMPRLLKRATYVYAEMSFIELYDGQVLAPELIAWLADQGFRIAGIFNLTTTAEGGSVQADALFSKDVN